MKGYIKKLIILAGLIIAGFILQLAGLLEPEKILPLARKYADQWWLVIVLIILQTVMFTFALAGSLFLWVAASLYPPLLSTLILATGATFGGVSAYYFSRRLTDDWVRKIENSHAYKILHQQDNFFTLFSLRVFPAFPHSLVNYSSGILQVKLSHFIPAAFIGVGIKSYIYSNVIYNATSAVSVGSLLNFKTFGPLILLSLITLLGVYIKFKFESKKI